MKLFSAAAALALVISLCGLTGDGTNAPDTNSANVNADANTVTAAGDPTSAADDERHKLFQAAAVTRDPDAMREVATTLGLADAHGKPNDEFPDFAREHFSWVTKNQPFVREINDPAKARDYVASHR